MKYERYLIKYDCLTYFNLYFVRLEDKLGKRKKKRKPRFLTEADVRIERSTKKD